eukprot:SAG11_NODE_75_length_18024_cov_5.885356_4_plen_72_part_00
MFGCIGRTSVHTFELRFCLAFGFCAGRVLECESAFMELIDECALRVKQLVFAFESGFESVHDFVSSVPLSQ